MEQACIKYVPLLSVSLWLLLFVLSYRTSVKLDFRQFLMIVVLKFGCNFDMVVGGGEYQVYLSALLTGSLVQPI